MELCILLSLLLIFTHNSKASVIELTTTASLDSEDDEHDLFSMTDVEDGGTLVVNSIEKDALDGMVWRKLKDNLTLFCAYHDANDRVIPADHMRLLWVLPNEDANRTTQMWISNGVLWLTVWQLASNDAGRYACIDREDPLLVGQAQLIIRPSIASPYPFCSPSSMFMCWGREPAPHGIKGPQCILFSYLCDGRADCPNGRDEHPETCFTEDPCHNKLMCADGRCIPKDWCCGNGTTSRYGRNGYTCIPHPCCVQHFKPVEKLGGGWRKKPGTPPLLQMTLYTASFCVLIFLISITFLISIICRARLKRSAEMGRAALANNPRQDPPPITPSQRCNYTLVPASCETPTSTYSSVFRRYFGPPIPNITPPSYSQATAENQDDAELPSYFEVQQEAEITESNGVEVRRPTDFGMSTLASALFNARYRPVPQEIVSFGDVSDSDSSCRSPGSHTFNIYPSPSGGGQRVDSPRFGETSDAYRARRSAEQRRLRRANALDRILDRFGLNAPYAVGRETTLQNRSPSPGPTTTAGNDNTGRRQFLSSILERLRNSFTRNALPVEQPSAAVDGENVNNETVINNNNTTQTERRRPDTPDVLELSLDEMCRNLSGDTFTLNGRTIHLLGASFEDRPELYSLNLQGFCVVDGLEVNLDRFVGRPVSPPPYSEVANVAPPKIMGPPPPYKSRENLNNISDAQPGPSCSNVTPDNIVVGQEISEPSTSSGIRDNNDNLNSEVFMDIVNCRDDSMSSLNLESAASRDKDLQNGNVCKDDSVQSFSLIDNANLSMSSNYSLKCVPTCNSGDTDNNNFDMTSPSCSNNINNNTNHRSVRSPGDSVVGRSDTLNDISNNNASVINSSEANNARQFSLNTLVMEQNGNASTTLDCARELAGKSQSVQRSVFPPISLEFIDSDCVTE